LLVVLCAVAAACASHSGSAVASNSAKPIASNAARPIAAIPVKPAAAPSVWPSEPAMPAHARRGRIVLIGDSVLMGAGITQPGKTLGELLGDLLHRPAESLGLGGVTPTLVRLIPSIPADATTVVLYAGSNDVVAAAQNADPDQAKKNVAVIFEPDFDRLVHGVRARVPNAEIALVTVRDLGRSGVHAPHISGASVSAAVAEWDTHERSVAKQLGIRAVVDTETDPKWYLPAEYTGEGYHPRNAALVRLANDLAAQLAPG